MNKSKVLLLLVCFSSATILPAAGNAETRTAYCFTHHRNGYNDSDPIYYSAAFSVEMKDFTAHDGPYSINGLGAAFVKFVNTKYGENAVPGANATECHTLHDPDDENTSPETQYADVKKLHPGIDTGWRP